MLAIRAIGKVANNLSQSHNEGLISTVHFNSCRNIMSFKSWHVHEPVLELKMSV